MSQFIALLYSSAAKEQLQDLVLALYLRFPVGERLDVRRLWEDAWRVSLRMDQTLSEHNLVCLGRALLARTEL